MNISKNLKNFHPREKISNFYDKIVDIYIYSAITGLVVYMVTSFIFKLRGTYNEYILGMENPKIANTEISQIGTLLQQELLHNIAFTIVLIKAYIIMREYAKHRHLSIKYMLEIAIIAPVVEIIFNYHSYELPMIIFYGIFSACVMTIYFLFYEKIKASEEDYKKSHI